MTSSLLLPYLVLAATLMRALLISLKVVAPLCARCGRSLERRHLGERICSGGH
jgi:hypothetical protein